MPVAHSLALASRLTRTSRHAGGIRTLDRCFGSDPPDSRKNLREDSMYRAGAMRPLPFGDTGSLGAAANFSTCSRMPGQNSIALLIKLSPKLGNFCTHLLGQLDV